MAVQGTAVCATLTLASLFTPEGLLSADIYYAERMKPDNFGQTSTFCPIPQAEAGNFGVNIIIIIIIISTIIIRSIVSITIITMSSMCIN